MNRRRINEAHAESGFPWLLTLVIVIVIGFTVGWTIHHFGGRS